MDNKILIPDNQCFIDNRKYVHSISIIDYACHFSDICSVTINKFIRSNYQLINEPTEYGFTIMNDSKYWIQPIAGRPLSCKLGELTPYQYWLFEILENLRYFSKRLDDCKLLTNFILCDKTVFNDSIKPEHLKYSIENRNDNFYFRASYEHRIAYESINIKK